MLEQERKKYKFDTSEYINLRSGVTRCSECGSLKSNEKDEEIKQLRDALLWARTYIQGDLPDKNTMTKAEIKEYLKELRDKIESALGDDSTQDRTVSTPDGTVVSITTPESSTINTINYSYPDKRMTVGFKSGGRYEYKDVPEKVFSELRSSDSKGKYFAANIKGKYNGEKV